MSSTTECLAGYIWFTSVDNHISQCISRVYAHDLQLQWLEDLQPQLLAENMNSILQDIETQEEMSIQYSWKRSNFTPNKFHTSKFTNQRVPSQTSNNSKSCIICKAAGRSHDITKCWFISQFEKLQISKAFGVEVDGYSVVSSERNVIQFVHDNYHPNTNKAATHEKGNVKNIQCDVFPYIYAYYKHHPFHNWPEPEIFIHYFLHHLEQKLSHSQMLSI